jgi:hypothetical protein
MEHDLKLSCPKIIDRSNIVAVAADTIGWATINIGNVITIHHNGDIYIKGNLTENDKELVEEMRKFFLQS